MEDECSYPNLILSSDSGYLDPYLQKVLKSLAPIQAPIIRAAGLLTSLESCPKCYNTVAHKKIECRPPEGLKTGSISSLRAS